jgi:hypothetical protein
MPRQTGKSLTAAAKALLTALTRPKSLSVIISRSQNQAAEVLLKVKILYNAYADLRRERLRLPAWRPTPLGRIPDDSDELGVEVIGELDDFAVSVRDNVLRKEFSNGSRIVTMACKGETSVGSTTDLLILDEAARMPDPVYYSVRPTLAIAQSKGRGELLCLSTPFGKRGWFWDAWKGCEEAELSGKTPAWSRTTIAVEQCPRITAEFLDQEREAMGDHWYEQEYMCRFREAVDAVFRESDISRATSNTVPGRLFAEV